MSPPLNAKFLSLSVNVFGSLTSFKTPVFTPAYSAIAVAAAVTNPAIIPFFTALDFFSLQLPPSIEFEFILPHRNCKV